MARRAPDALKEVIRDFRRDQIVDTARRLFGERGTTDVSMDEIAAEAGVARSTVYVYFANRDDLLGACVQSMYDRLVDTIALVVDDGDTRRWSACAGSCSACSSGSTRAPPSSAWPWRPRPPRAAGSAAVGGALMMIGLDMIRVLEELVVAGVATGDFRADLDPERAVVLVGQQIYGALSVRAGEPEPRFRRRQAADEICDFVYRGLGA